MPKSLYELYQNFPKPAILTDEAQQQRERAVRLAIQSSGSRVGAGAEGRIFSEDRVENMAIQIAYNRAERVLNWVAIDTPMDMDIIQNHPGIDPIGKFTEVDMLFEQRLDRVRKAIPLCNDAQKGTLQRIFSAMDHPESKDEMAVAYQNMRKDCKAIRENRMAALLCDDGRVSGMLEQKCEALKDGNAIRYFDNLLTCLEGIAGLKEFEYEHDEPFTSPSGRQYNGKDDLVNHLVNDYRPVKGGVMTSISKPAADPNPTIHFPSFQNILKQNWYAYPGNWGKEPTPEAMTPKDSPYLQNMIQDYCGAIAKRTMDNILPENAQNIMGNRNALVIVDGKTIDEHMRERYMGYAKENGIDVNSQAQYSEWYQKNRNTLGMQILAAGVESGKRVEAFIPDAQGYIPEKPVQITKSGDHAMDLKPVTMNAWQRFFSHLGFYKKEVARADEYKRTMEARERVRKQYGRLENGKMLRQMDQADRDHNQLYKAFFGDRKVEWNHYKEFNPLSVCVTGLLARGISIEDIANPNARIEEKREIGQQYIKNRADLEGAKKMTDGVIALQKQYKTLNEKVDMNDPRQFLQVYPQLKLMESVFSDFNNGVKSLWTDVRDAVKMRLYMKHSSFGPPPYHPNVREKLEKMTNDLSDANSNACKKIVEKGNANRARMRLAVNEPEVKAVKQNNMAPKVK